MREPLGRPGVRVTEEEEVDGVPDSKERMCCSRAISVSMSARISGMFIRRVYTDEHSGGIKIISIIFVFH